MHLRAGSLAYRCQVTLLGLIIAAAFLCLQTACGGASEGSHIITQPPPPPPAGSVPITFFAVNDTTPTDAPQNYGLNYGTLGHPVPLAWQTIEAGGSGSFDFSQFDGFAENVAPKDANGTALMVMTLGMTPPWATSDTSTCRTGSGTSGCTAPPTNISDWTTFIQALVNHYNGTTAPHIKYYEIWNEADPNSEYWTGTAQQLEQLAAAAYPIIKTDPYSQVVTPSMAGNVYSTGPFATIPFLTAYFNAGGNQFADAVSFHGFVYNLNYVPYPLPTQDCSGSDSNCGGPIMAQVQAYRNLMDSFGMNSMPLLNTEGGFEDATISNADTAAAWLAQYYALQASMYNTYDIAMVSWFTWGATDGQLENNNVLTNVGVAYNQVSNWVVDRNLASPCSAPTGTVWTCAMTGSNGYQAEIIWDSSQTCSNGVCTTSAQSVASTYTSYLDLSGNSTPISGGTVQVGLKPILLQN